MNKDISKYIFDDYWRRKRWNGGASWAAWNPPREPEPVAYVPTDEWPTPKPRDDLVFAKSCTPENWCRTNAGTAPEPAANFGKVMVAGAMLFPSAGTAVATAFGADLALGRMAGGGILQQRLNWAIRGAGGPASVFILGMLPTKMGDGTLHTDEQLRTMTRATTRVRFQFRRDAEGVMQVYGIHTGASGDDSVRTVNVKWNEDKTAMEAKLNGITILWTPQRGPLGSMPPLIYPEHHEHLSPLLVHPIPENTDSQIDGLPGEDITAEDCILVFPETTGLKSLYVVFARPAGGGDIKYHTPPLTLPAFPDAVRVRRKGNRARWESKKRIYEWDYQHGAVEVYDWQNNHLGEFDANTGEQTGKARPEGKTTTN